MVEDTLPRMQLPSPRRETTAPRDFDFSPWTALPPLMPTTAAPAKPPRGAPSVFERGVAILVLVALSPLFAIVALAIKLTSPGPVFYRQERVGLDRRSEPVEPSLGAEERRNKPGAGQLFMIWKFRTMIPNAEASTGPVWASQNDPRVTPVGRLLRTLRLDEFPQFMNVVQGHMRLIGPRPERPQFVAQLVKAVPEYRRRHSVPPGITGLAQVQRSYDVDLDDVRTKLKYDLYYVDNRSRMLHLKIMMKTVDVVLRGRGAH
jgi:lipopolysaccharide/colanic/teichoic acid biosynthesis glycosyltransferase